MYFILLIAICLSSVLGHLLQLYLILESLRLSLREEQHVSEFLDLLTLLPDNFTLHIHFFLEMLQCDAHDLIISLEFDHLRLKFTLVEQRYLL